MKSKRWKRRNRHTRPEWVSAWNQCLPDQFVIQGFNGKLYIEDVESLRWITTKMEYEGRKPRFKTTVSPECKGTDWYTPSFKRF